MRSPGQSSRKVRYSSAMLVLLLACDSPNDKSTDLDVGHDSADSGLIIDDSGGDSSDTQSDSDGETGEILGDTGPLPPGCAAEANPDAACDDATACTVDTCDMFTGECTNAAFDGDPLDLWDMDLMRDASTLDVEVLGSETVLEGLTLVDVHEIRFTAYEYSGCVLNPVRIEAFIAVPQGVSMPMPGLIVAHGLGGYAEAGSARTPAAQLGVVALAYSGTGQGNSEGTGSTSDHLFDTATDPRNSWFWEHAATAMRGLTVLGQLSEVDPTRLAMTGYSGGSVATWMVAGIDDRLAAAFPVSATGHLDLAIAATPNPGWEADLLNAMTVPKTSADIEWANYSRWLDPKNYLPSLHAPVMLVNGAQDEFFPVTSTLATMNDAIAAQPESRLLMVANWDHGWYAYFTGDEAERLANAAIEMWMGNKLGNNGTFGTNPPMPVVDSVSAWTCYDPTYWWVTWNCSAVIASVPGLTDYEIESATFWFSVDNALTFTSWNLQEYSDGTWYAEVGTLDGTVYTAANTVWFVDFELSAGVFGPTFDVTTLPNVPAGFSPYILTTDGPIP